MTTVRYNSSATVRLKTPKGTRDYNDKEMAVREQMFDTIKRVFQRHGAVTIDTPAFELREVLAGKYGEEGNQLMYDLADQGGELCSLRYDLTVPLARFLAMHGKEYAQLKRYQIAKVYRRDQPAMTKGRLREFYQCDFDIAGRYDPMIPDAEVLRILCEALNELQVGEFAVRLNHRKILDGVFQACGVPEDKIRSVSSAVDKLDKMPWTLVRKEMVETRGVPVEVADRIGQYVELRGSADDVLATLERDDRLATNPLAQQGIADMRLLFEYLEVLDAKDKMQMDLSLARGLDYYTGVIYEAVMTENKSIDGIGSIAAGGRYDDLVKMFAGRNKKGEPNLDIPCVGLSLGVERIFSILMARQSQNEIKSKATQVYVMAVDNGFLKERMAIAKELWDQGISASFTFKEKPKLEKQWASIRKDKVPIAAIIGGEELQNNQVRLKDMRLIDKAQGPGKLVARSDLVTEIKRWLEYNP